MEGFYTGAIQYQWQILQRNSSDILSFIVQILSKQLGIVCIILILSFGHYAVILIVKDCFNAYILLPEAFKLLRHYCNRF